MGRLADRLFWSEEQQAKTDERFRRERERREAQRETSANTHVKWRVSKNLLSLVLTVAVGAGAAALCRRVFGFGDTVAEAIGIPLALLFLGWLGARGFYSVSWRENPTAAASSLDTSTPRTRK